MRQEPFDLDSPGGKLRGFVHRPRGQAKAAVVILHGWVGYCAGPHRILYELAEACGEADLATLRFDFFGRGDSDGRCEEATFARAVDDARRVAAWAQERLGEMPLMMVGMCFGASVGWRCMELWQSMVLLSPERMAQKASLPARLATLAQHAGRIARKAVSPGAWSRLVGGQTSAGAAYRFYTRSGALPYRVELPTRRAAGATAVLLLQGSADPSAGAVRQQYQVMSRKLGVRCESHVVAGADHNFCSVAWKREAIAAAAGWLRGRVQERQGCSNAVLDR
ncbi:MAG: alpha/beta fold hydrolase [Phycisphaerae bacterium]|jgi:hypothetical protein